MRLDSMSQGSNEWLKLRKTKVTATDAGVILGISPYQSSYGLWAEKMSLSPPVQETERMREGKRLEPIALQEFTKITGILAYPAIVISDERSWQMASLDGLSDDNKSMVEIKCGPKTCALAKQGIIEPHYRAQLHHQMSVMSLKSMFFFTFDGYSSNIMEVERDDAFIADMITKEHEFYKCIDNFDPPALSDKDYTVRNDDEWKKASEMYLASCHRVKFWEEEQEYWRKILIEAAGSSNVKGEGVRVAKSVRKGAIEYKAIPELKGLDLEQYRKKPSEYWRIGIE